jgi:hypothetical protein
MSGRVHVGSIWVESLTVGFEQAFDLLGAAVRDCPDQLWESSMWDVPAPAPGSQFIRSDWTQITDEAENAALSRRWVERYSTPWSVAWHALECVDYDLNGDLAPWAPPAPFSEHPHWRDLATLPAAWSQTQILGYVDHCAEQVRKTLAEMTEEKAATPLPESHRYGGQPHALIITGMIGHTTEHGSQIRQFITAAGVAPSA